MNFMIENNIFFLSSYKHSELKLMSYLIDRLQGIQIIYVFLVKEKTMIEMRVGYCF